MTQTLQGVVNKELQQILGRSQTIEDLPPEKRGEVWRLSMNWRNSRSGSADSCRYKCKYEAKTTNRKRGTPRFILSLNARSGENRFSVFVFPGKKKEVEKLLDWTPRLESLTGIFAKLTTGGITPTGPAINEAISYFKKKRSLRSLLTGDDESFFEESV